MTNQETPKRKCAYCNKHHWSITHSNQFRVILCQDCLGALQDMWGNGLSDEPGCTGDDRMRGSVPDTKIIHEMLWYLFNKVPMPEADLHSALEDGSAECERVDELFWRVLKAIEEVNTIEQIAALIDALRMEEATDE